MDEEEEPEDEEMEDKIHEMQVASPQRSPRHPAEKRTEREDTLVGSMRQPSMRGKHEAKGSKSNQAGVREEEMQVLEGRREDNLVEEGTLEGEDDEIGGEDEFMYASASKNGMMGKDNQATAENEDVMREVEDNKLSFLREEYEDEGRENQGEEEKEEQSLVSEEEEWDDTELEREAKEIKENSKKEVTETVEGKDTTEKTKRGDKLAVKANQASAETARKVIEDTKRELMRNPYFKSAKEKFDCHVVTEPVLIQCC
jgi:hypothetical protein